MALVATVLLLALNFRRLVDFYDRLYKKTVYWILGKNPRAEIAESKAYEAFLLEEYALALEFYQIAERFGGGSTTHFQRKGPNPDQTPGHGGCQGSLAPRFRTRP
jgi:hypothetical protein